MIRLPSLAQLDRATSARWVCTAAADMRKGFDSLAALVREGLKLDPLSVHLFFVRGA